jgi:hypothetical protein
MLPDEKELKMKKGLLIALMAIVVMHWSSFAVIGQEEHKQEGQTHEHNEGENAEGVEHGEKGNWMAEFDAADRLQVMIQQICPVSGEKLGSMGAPIKIAVGEETVFLCCEGCESGEISADHWKTIQSNIAAAQGTCPVMDKAVTAESTSLVVEGRRVFICCPPCGPKIQADPATYFAKIDTSRMTLVADQLQIAAQKICPVTGEELGSMGTPVKVMVGEEAAFLCCAGCAKKQIDATHWATVQANLAAAQGMCPVMEKALPENAQSVVVIGRRVFVCCPPCIKKIQDDSATFISSVNGYLLKR